MKRTSTVIKALCLLLSLTCTKGQSSLEGDYGLEALILMINSNPERFCSHITCVENDTPETCPDGAVYVEGVAQFGCCGACVVFRKYSEACTGNIDPKYGGGYTSTTSVLGQSNGGIISDVSPPNSNVLYSSWCGYALKCAKGDQGANYICLSGTSDNDCGHIQLQYDNFISSPSDDQDPNSKQYTSYRDDYRWRPNCTDYGEFVAKQCKGPRDEERCVCVDPAGNTIFGSAFRFQTDLYDTMNCKCSRKSWEKYQAGESTVTLHCAENGNYEPLQCEDGWCYCMDPIKAEPYGALVPESSMKLLPCYNNVSMGQQYLRRCESEFHAHNVLADTLRRKGVQPPSTSLTCDPDGSYSPVQYDGPDPKCYDRYKNWIRSPGAGRCQCAIDGILYKEWGVEVPTQCDPNTGMYQEIQTQGNTAFCVDKDGVRSGPLVYTTYTSVLDCATSIQCQYESNDNCDLVCPGCPEDAYVKRNN